MSEREVVRLCRCSGEIANTHMVLEYRNGSGFIQIPATEKLLRRMGDRLHQFFYAKRRSDGSWKIEHYAPWQEAWMAYPNEPGRSPASACPHE